MVSFAKIIISLSLVAYLLTNLDTEAIIAAFSGVNYMFLLIAFVSYVFIPIIQAFRWKSAVAIFKGQIGIRDAFLHTYVGIFFSNFLPSIGGEFVKGVYTSVCCKISSLICFMAIIVEKVFGFIAVLVIFAVAVTLSDNWAHFAKFIDFNFDEFMTSTESYSGYSVGLVFVFFLLTSFVYIFLKFFKSFLSVRRITLPVMESDKAKSGIQFSILIVAATTTQILQTLSYIFVALALEMNVDLFTMIVFSQVITLAIYLPISFGGWGVREMLLVSGANFLNSGAEDLMVLGIISGLIPMVGSLPGLYIWHQTKIDTSKMELPRFLSFWKK